MPSTERINYLFRRFFDKTYTPEEREELIEYINKSEFDNQLKTLIEESWTQDIPEYEQDARKVDDIFRYILQQEQHEIRNAPRRSRFRKIYLYAGSVAAALVLAVAGYYWWVQPVNPSGTSYAVRETFRCNPGERKTFHLPDGSTVKLNSNSSLTILSDFTAAKRWVRLEGEGFFDVAHNPEKPFTIITNQMFVKVLGTSFNVKAYEEDDIFETSVIRGSVEVMLTKNKQKVVLHPNEKISLANNAKTIVAEKETLPVKIYEAPESIATIQPVTRNKDSSIVEISWTMNKLAFADDPFNEIAKKIERWYNVKVLFQNDAVKEAIKDERFTATFNNEKLELVMQALQLTSRKFSYRIDKNQNVIISK